MIAAPITRRLIRTIALAPALAAFTWTATLHAAITEAYVAVQARDIEGPDAGTDPVSVAKDQAGIGTFASGVAGILIGGEPGQPPRPVEQVALAIASVDDPGPGDDTGAFTVASAHTRMNVQALVASPTPAVFLALVDVRVHGAITVSGEATGSVYARAIAYDPLGRAFPEQQTLQLLRQESSQTIDHTFSLLLSEALYLVMRDDSNGMGLDLELSVEAHATGVNSFAGVDLSRTLDIASFRFYDDQGAFVPGLSVLDEFGGRYPVNLPEPTGLAACGWLLAFVAGRWRLGDGG